MTGSPQGPAHTVIQLTDTHLSGGGQFVRESADTTGNLRLTLDHLEASGRSVDAIIVSGDLADAGELDAYRRLRSMIEPTAQRMGARLCYAMGNHDDRASFRIGLGVGRNGSTDLAAPYDRVDQVGDLRIVTLDSTVPGRHDGAVDEARLAWLHGVLREESPGGSLLVLHHPPVRSPVTTVDHLRLNRPEALTSAIRGSDIRMILCGHAHHTGASALAGIPVWIGPPVSYRTDALPPAGRHRAGVGFGFSRIDLFGESAVATAVDVVGVDDLYSEPEAVVLERLRALTSEGV
ncbi:metallophosphoesterase [Gordonia soli]|uniref:Putative 3',5'-cyclic-nucleotide phosphodiesterase n=1 Tax=Gordonia soli NBRC 108243 TaxID=1223545 RepID=M0QJ69_9ACTN|nr:metallophosphoesterase [Gordonia soli]GAC68675.1 putative 3',5'-cyclic-nucleotide phosphodiesterase [Gordonia soli NBRC 108243]